MRKLLPLLAAGALALTGTAALASGSNVHHMTVRLADGSVASIEYTGNVAPKVSLAAPAPLSWAAFAPHFDFVPFANLRQIDATIDSRMHAMQRQIDSMMTMPLWNSNTPLKAAFGKMGSHFCAQSVQITVGANGKQNIVRHSAGDCGGAHAAVAHQAPAPGHHGNTI